MTRATHDGPDTARRRFGPMTEQEFVDWCDEDTRSEWIDGEVIVMSPVSLDHSTLNRWLLAMVGEYVEHKDRGLVVGPEYQVRFAQQRSRRTPDLMFVAKRRVELAKKNHFEGAPDLIMEIVSPDSESRDWREKYLEYQSAGVREYWVFDPMSQNQEAYALVDANSYLNIEEKDDKIESQVLSGFYLRPSWLWAQKRPPISVALREMGLT
jgi:Uma2 family endonuclease